MDKMIAVTVDTGIVKPKRKHNHNQKYGHAWKRLRDKYIKQHPFCERCLAAGIETQATEVHHRLPVISGGSHGKDNLMSVCCECHRAIHMELDSKKEV